MIDKTVYIVGTVFLCFLLYRRLKRDIDIHLPFYIMKHGEPFVGPDGKKGWVLNIGFIRLIYSEK